MDSARQIEQQAAAWLAKRDNEGLSESDERCLKAWIEEAAAHRIAYLRLEMVWEETRRLRSVAAGLPPDFGEKNNWILPLFDARQLVADADPTISAADELDAAAFPVLTATGQEAPRASASTRGRVWAVAAAVGLSIGAAYLGYGLLTGGQYATQVGVVTSVPLPDGSSMILNTASKVRVELNPQERRVDLTRGEAYFDVAKDPKRPFVVTAENKRITAIGTAFSVRRENDGLRVDGNELPGTPEYSFKGLVRYDFAPTALGEFAAQADFTYLASQFYQLDNNERDAEDSYGVLNVRAFWSDSRDRFHVQAFVENVTDTTYASYVGTWNGFDTRYIWWGRPRTWGVRAGVDF